MGYEDRDKYGMYKDSAGPGPALMGADTLIGDSVVNAQGDTLGDIKEIMLDMQTGQVAYAVLSFGGFLGVGDKLFAVPWQALHLDTVGKRFVLNVDKDALQNAPGFDKHAWPDMADMTWAGEVHSFYGVDPSHGGAPTMGAGPALAGGAGRVTSVGGPGVGAGMGSLGAGHAGSDADSGAGAGLGTGAGAGTSIDPRAGTGTPGDDTDLSRIRGSNIG